MPELPEVETIKRIIKPQIVRQTITSVEVRNAQVIAYPAENDFVQLLSGQTIKDMSRRGKFLSVDFVNGDRLFLHLRMTGQLLVTTADYDIEKHTQLDKNVAGWKARPQISYEMAIVRKDTNEKIGRAEIIRDYSEDSAMIGCLLLKSEWGKGYATEIGNALIDYCFNELQVHRVYGLCHPDNTGSWKTMEKCGMHREAHFIQKRKYTKAEGIRWEDELEYAIIRTGA